MSMQNSWTQKISCDDAARSLRSTLWERTPDPHYNTGDYWLMYLVNPVLALFASRENAARTPADSCVENALQQLHIGYSTAPDRETGKTYVTVVGEDYKRLATTLGYDPISEQKGRGY